MALPLANWRHAGFEPSIAAADWIFLALCSLTFLHVVMANELPGSTATATHVSARIASAAIGADPGDALPVPEQA